MDVLCVVEPGPSSFWPKGLSYAQKLIDTFLILHDAEHIQNGLRLIRVVS